MVGDTVHFAGKKLGGRMNINNICGVTSCRHCFDGNCNRSYWDECEFRIAFENQIKNKWIPCSERLPEEHEEPKDIYDPFTLAIEDTQYIMTSNLVLVTVLDLEKESIFVLDDCTVGGKWCNKSDTWEIIAWQPLPEPYKEQSNEA